MSAIVAARAMIRRSANSEAERDLFLQMLGLDRDDAVIVREMSSPIPLGKADVTVTRPVMELVNAQPVKSTAPESLRNLPPVKASRPVKPRSELQRKGPPQDRNQALQQPCGTEAAARRHVANREPICDVCLKGREARKTQRVYETAPCGTPSAFQRHKRHGEPVDQACQDAHNEDRRKRRARKRAAKGLPPLNRELHGTAGGYKRHHKLGEPKCAECLAWKAANDKAYKARKKEKRQ